MASDVNLMGDNLYLETVLTAQVQTALVTLDNGIGESMMSYHMNISSDQKLSIVDLGSIISISNIR